MTTRRAFLMAIAAALAGQKLLPAAPDVFAIAATNAVNPVRYELDSSMFQVGDVLTFEGYFQWDPTTRHERKPRKLQQFIVYAIYPERVDLRPL